MSLAGVQEKLPVFVDGHGHISVPVDGTPSTHILKPDTKRLAGSVENEAFCLSLARAYGLEAAEATIGVAGKRRYLLVKRYDRFTDFQGEIRRLRIRRIFASQRDISRRRNTSDPRPAAA